MYLGRPTGAAMPLMWAHAEYIKLLRSVHDGVVFDLVPAVAQRYRQGSPRRKIEVWKPNRHPPSVAPGSLLRIQARAPFRLVWSADDWQTTHDTPSSSLLGFAYVDIPVDPGQRAPIVFTFFWTGEQRWEGRNYEVPVVT